MGVQGKVQILMSAYNGEKYLEEQLESLLYQTYSNIEIIIRDDGSTDGTEKLLKIYEENHSNIKVIREENVGVVDSFFGLLKKSDAEYIAFCDQDDIWMKQKVEMAVLALSGENMPAVYCGNKLLVNADLEEMGIADTQRMNPGFGNAVVENIATGCTILINRKLAEILKEHIPKHAILHDWWCYLVASYCGKVIYDQTPYIYYRQHENNQVGGKAGFVGQIAAKKKYLKKSRGKLRAQLTEFHHYYHGDKEKDQMLASVLETTGLGGKILMLFNAKIYRQKKLDNLIIRVLFLTNNML